MRIGQTALLGGLTILLAGHAQAGGWSESCDWFENAVAGTRCAQSFVVSTRLDYGVYDYNNSAWHSTQDYYITGGGLAITPNSWLTFQFNSLAYFEDVNWTYKGKPYVLNTSFTYDQSLSVNANVIDTGPGAQRFVLNTYAGAALLPAHGTYGDETAVYGGLTANWQRHLGSSGYSIEGLVQLEADNWDPDAKVFLYPDVRLLLSNDKLGVAAGPVFHSAQWVSSDHAVSSQSSYYAAGGAFIAQPFRSSSSTFLNGIMLQSTVEQSIGQANWVPSGTAKTDSLQVNSTLSFHFRY